MNTLVSAVEKFECGKISRYLQIFVHEFLVISIDVQSFSLELLAEADWEKTNVTLLCPM